MRGRRTLVKGILRVSLVAGMALGGMMAHAGAEDLYRFTDDASLTKAMAELNEAMQHEAKPPEPCRLDVLSDQRGHQLFDEQTSSAMHRALAAEILGEDQVDGCVLEGHEVDQSEVPAFLEERRKAGELGHSLALSYYKLSEAVTVFAILRDADGGILGSTGRFDLPVTLAAGDALAETAAEAAETEPEVVETEPEVVETEAEVAEAVAEVEPEPEVAAEETSPAVETASPPEAPSQAAAPPAPVNGTASSEATYRRQLAADRRTEHSPERAFNLRRVQAGVPSSIRTVRIVDASGQKRAMLADLAAGFLGERATSPVSSVEAIDVQTVDGRSAFEDILDNEGDIVVTLEPISSADAGEFTQTYGVNMRSRYAEHVVAIAKNDAGSLACGIDYPENGMLMSTEDHPASERVYFYVNPSIPNAVRDRFIDFTLSEQGQEVVAKHAVDLRLQLSDAGYAAWRYQAASEQEAEIPDLHERFRDLIRTSQRVSSTFRFDFASADLVLDSRSEQDLENLIDLVKAREIDGRRILLFGFADSAGPADFNADLSRNRADAVATRLRLAGISVPPRNVHGIGEDSPVACNLLSDGDRDELGARKNRRVEVWIDS